MHLVPQLNTITPLVGSLSILTPFFELFCCHYTRILYIILTMNESYQKFNEAKLSCRSCEVGMAYDQVVPSDGDTIHPVVMVIGEAPGKDELTQGSPFVGKCGKLLRNNLRVCGCHSGNTVITNVLPCRPPKNKFPKDNDLVKSCVNKWLMEEIKILKPSIILLVGSTPLKFVLGMKGITSCRGKWYPLKGMGFPVICMPTYHPSYVLRKEHMKEGPEIRLAFVKDIEAVTNVAGFNPVSWLPE
jgi:DNA polymerase